MADHMSGTVKGALRDVRELRVLCGSTFRVDLWEDRTRGEQWVPSYDPRVLALVADDFLRTVSNNAVDSGRRRFEFHALEVGDHTVEFSKRMAWKFTSEARRVFRVTVHN